MRKQYKLSETGSQIAQRLFGDMQNLASESTPSPKAKPAKRKTNATKKPRESGGKSAKPSTDSNALLVTEEFHVKQGQIAILTIFEAGAENSSTTRLISFPSAGDITARFTTTPHGLGSTGI